MASFKCSICGDTFDNGDELAEHVREDHGGQDVEDYQCSVCGQRFESEGDLVSHMAGAHPNQQ